MQTWLTLIRASDNAQSLGYLILFLPEFVALYCGQGASKSS